MAPQLAAFLHDFLDRRCVGAVGHPVRYRLAIAGQSDSLAGLERLAVGPAFGCPARIKADISIRRGPAAVDHPALGADDPRRPAGVEIDGVGDPVGFNHDRLADNLGAGHPFLGERCRGNGDEGGT